jgi:hypothetical protein
VHVSVAGAVRAVRELLKSDVADPITDRDALRAHVDDLCVHLLRLQDERHALGSKNQVCACPCVRVRCFTLSWSNA